MCACLCVFDPECYSEGSDHEDEDSSDAPPPPYSEQMSTDSGNETQVSETTTNQSILLFVPIKRYGLVVLRSDHEMV